MEDFGYLKEEEQSKFTRILKKMFMLGATLLSIACFIYVTVNAYYYVYDEDNGQIETITSPEEPIKIMAEESSDNQETTIVNNSIYEDIFGNKAHKKETSNPKIHAAPAPAIPPKIEPDRRLVKETTSIGEVFISPIIGISIVPANPWRVTIATRLTNYSPQQQVLFLALT